VGGLGGGGEGLVKSRDRSKISNLMAVLCRTKHFLICYSISKCFTSVWVSSSYSHSFYFWFPSYTELFSYDSHSHRYKSHISEVDDAGLLGCDTVSLGKWFPKCHTDTLPTYRCQAIQQELALCHCETHDTIQTKTHCVTSQKTQSSSWFCL
jgi:hypothetical protein